MANRFHVEGTPFGDLILSLGDGDFVVPNFQREFTWEDEDINQLMRSIFNQFFIGALFLWQSPEDDWVELLDCEIS